MKPTHNIKLIYIDLFCGAGGTSTGVENARHSGSQCSKVIACVNHDKNAIASHAANHPEALHFTEDIRTLELSPLIKHVKKMKATYPNAFIVLWASLECTNFSKAKGGLPRDADSRTLAEHLFRYIESINPDYIQIENVEEFMTWGPLDKNSKPIPERKGEYYHKWLKDVKSYSYNFEHRILNSANYGAYTSRRRFFGVFAKNELPIVFPEQTHAKKTEKSLLGSYKQWKPVKEVLDFSDVGVSIFNRKKDIVEKTLERTYAGLIKFVAGGKDRWLLKYNSINKKTGKHIPPSIDEPCPVVSCQSRLGVMQADFLSQYNGGSPNCRNLSVDNPCGVVTTHNRFAKVGVSFLAKYFGGHPESKIQSITEPCGTLTTKDRYSKIGIHFLSKQFSGHPDSKNISIDAPAGAITTIDHHAFMSAYYGCGFNTSIESPSPTVTTKDRFSLIQSQFLDMQYGNGTPSSLENPAPTVTTNPKHNVVAVGKFLMNPQYNSVGGSIDNPCFTLIARMDKAAPYLISADTEKSDNLPPFIRFEGDAIIYEIYDTDSPMTIKIKEFMALYGIVDIKMRMLRIPELKQIMGFPKDYVLIGTQAEQKKYIGNAVEVTMARVLCEALCIELSKLSIKPAKKAA